MKLIEINTLDELKEKMKTNDLVILLYGLKCGPCLKLKPLLDDKIMRTESDKTLYVKISKTQSKEINEYLNLKRLPLVSVIKNSELVYNKQSADINVLYPDIIKILNLEDPDTYIIDNDF